MTKPSSKPSSKKSFLLLQGVATPFFSELGKALGLVGHDVLKVNFCGGDLLSGRFFSTTLKHINYQGDLAGLESFYRTVYDDNNITDILLFGDTRPIHTPALSTAKEMGIDVHIYEEGYFRPNWITLDKGGVNAYSSLSKDPSFYKSNDDGRDSRNPTKNTTQNAGGGLAIRAWHDIRFYIASFLLKPIFPHYQSHRPDSASKEYWGWIKRLPSLYFYYNDHAKQKIITLLKSKKTFYLLPLQLDADSQMRIHSPIKTVTALIETTIKSFAKYAPADSILVIKTHPLDPWFINYAKVMNDAGEKYGVENNRLIHLESGNLNSLLKHAKGTVLANSTVGTLALTMGRPVIALGLAIYNMKGLTFQGGLDQFWKEATVPDKQLFDSFQQYVIEKTQINGAFYNQKGIELAVQGSLSKLRNEIS